MTNIIDTVLVLGFDEISNASVTLQVEYFLTDDTLINTDIACIIDIHVVT